MNAVKYPLVLRDTAINVADTDFDEFTAARVNSGHRGLHLYSVRTADTGTSALNHFLQGLIPGGDETDDADWLDLTLSVAVWGDGETGVNQAIIYPGITAADADGVILAVSTAGAELAYVNAYLPYRWRIRSRSGGTTVTNTYGLYAVPLP